MEKSHIWFALFVGSVIGGWIGSVIDGGNIFGLWSILLGTVGAIAAIWLLWKLES